MLALLPLMWKFIKEAREKEEAERNELPYQNLDTKQILGKIARK